MASVGKDGTLAHKRWSCKLVPLTVSMEYHVTQDLLKENASQIVTEVFALPCSWQHCL